MPRKSAVSKLPKEARDSIRERLADGSETLAQVRDGVAAEFPGVDVPGTTSLHREQQRIKAWAKRAAEAKSIQEAWFDTIGKNPESQAGKMLQETLRILIFYAGEKMQESHEADEPIDVKALAALSRSYLAIENGARISAERERELIAEGERRAGNKAEAVGRQLGLTAEAAKKLRLQLGGAQSA